VGDKLSISILTDQDRVIKLAIEKGFSYVTHRFCLWHILKNFLEEYDFIYKDNSPFSRKLKNYLYHSITTKQFDGEWGAIMSRHKLINDE
jgi:hypothetical protein